MAKDKWVKIGVVGVDSGHLIITDYPNQREVREAHEIIYREGMPKYLQLKFDLGHEGAGVIFSTGLGDGLYPVYARIGEVVGSDGYNWGERIKEIRIKFIPHPVLGRR